MNPSRSRSVTYRTFGMPYGLMMGILIKFCKIGAHKKNNFKDDVLVGAVLSLPTAVAEISKYYDKQNGTPDDYVVAKVKAVFEGVTTFTAYMLAQYMF
jgi:hypothetical protein